MKRALLSALALGAALAPWAASAKIEPAFGVTIQSCVVNSNNGLTNGINVVYYNTHPSPAIEVDFLVRYHHHAYTLVDHGTFSQGAQINHNLANALVGKPWQGPEPGLCTVQRVYLQNGKVLE